MTELLTLLIGCLQVFPTPYTREPLEASSPPPPFSLNGAIAHALNLLILGIYQSIGSIIGSDTTRNAESMLVGCRAGLGVFGRRTSGLVLQLVKLFGVSLILLLTPNPALWSFISQLFLLVCQVNDPLFPLSWSIVDRLCLH